MRQTVIGVFRNENDAQTAVEQLVNDGISRSNIDVASKAWENYRSDDSTYRTDDTTLRTDDTTNSTTDNSFRSDDVTYNRNTADSSREGDFGDKVSRFFNNLFGDDNDEARTYSTAAQSGCVVTVHAESTDQAERAVDILDLYGAVDVNDDSFRMTDSPSNNTLYRGDLDSDNQFSATSDTENLYTERTDTDLLNEDRNNRVINEADASIPVIEEHLEVGKREVDRGGIRLRSRIVEKPVEENLRLRYERVTVERNPVNRAATSADFDNFKEGTVEMTEHAEVPVINKEARVVEEVRLGKEVEERTETVRDTVRHTDVEVEDFRKDKDYRGNS